jgi:hypothetical protein
MSATPPVKRPKSRKALNAANLEALGPERLAAILMDEADGRPMIKGRLRLELAAAMGPEALQDELNKRHEPLQFSRTRIHWRKQKEFRRDLELQRRTIVGPLAQADPARALELLLKFVALERGLLSRATDAKGEMAEIFSTALADLPAVAAQLAAPIPDLTETLIDALSTARVGAGGEVVAACRPALDAAGLDRLRARIEMESAPPRRANAIWRAPLQAVLEAQGDAAALADSFSAGEQLLPPVGARIARAYVAAGELDKAKAALDRSDPYADAVAAARRPGAVEPDAGEIAWDAARIALLEASGEADAAQAQRWASFERGLSAPALRDYLKRLTGFDDVVAEDKALLHARIYPRFAPALRFLIDWPSLETASVLVLERREDIDAADPLLLERAARALEGRYPLAAMLLLRAAIAHVARFARQEFFDDAQRWLLEAESLAAGLSLDDEIEPQADFAARIAGHRRW